MSDHRTEFFITASSFAAPFCGDISETYVKGISPRDALEQFVEAYSHPFGLYSAQVWTDRKHSLRGGSKPLLRYLTKGVIVE